jgi:Ca2+-binding EF-hand superfamily protein
MQEQQPQPIRKRRVRPNHRPKILFHPSKMDTIVNAIYTYYDCDRSEFLKKTEFAKVLSKLIRDMGGDPPNMEDIEDIIFELDVNGDGQISKE